jgi:hypothetical protein
LEAYRASKAELEVPTGAPTTSDVIDECDIFFDGPPDPTEELLLHLAPLKGYQCFRESYTSLAETHNVSQLKIKIMEAKVKKFQSPNFMPKSLTLPHQTLTFPKDTPDDSTCARHAIEFDAIIAECRQKACLKIKENLEHRLSLMREKLANELLQTMRSMANASAKKRIDTWNWKSDEDRQCGATAEIISKIV